MYFDERAPGNKSGRDRSLIRLLKSLAIMSSGISTIFSSSNSFELCDSLKLLLQEKQGGNNSNTNFEEIFTISDKLLE